VLTADDRQLLEAHAPYLQYDAQDAYRAVSAATMTDAPCNCLAQNGGTLIAGKGTMSELNLGVLSDYPGSLEFAEGDRLASAPNPLEDAVKLQSKPEFPHCAYGRVARRSGNSWLEYWLWYYDNPKTFLGKGRHQGDWELVVVEIDSGGAPRSVTCSQHGAGEARAWNAVEKQDGHPVVYVAPFSHANYFQPGTRFYFPAADHPTSGGPRRLPGIEEFGEWQEWGGVWGASRGPLGGRFNLGGESPPAPIRQEQRWFRPDSFHRGAVARKPIGWLKGVLWFIGKATFPLKPELLAASVDGTTVTVTYELPEQWLHRSRDMLLTVHTADERQDMLLSEVVRGAPRNGQAVLELPSSPRPELGYVVYGSAFNRLGQRSDPESVSTAVEE
jgi:hypothetical protein